MSNKLNILSLLILFFGINLLTSCDKSDDDIDLMIDCDSLRISIAVDSLTNMDSITLNAIVMGGTTPYAYNWSTGSQSSLIQTIQGGSFSLTVTDANGCEVSTTVNLNVSDPCASFNINIIDSLTNSSGNTFLFPSYTNGTPPYTYVWSEGSTTESIEPVSSDTYFLTVTDANGCTSVDSVDFIFTDPCISFSINIIDSLVNTAGNTILFPSYNNGTAPYTYNWSTGEITSEIEPMSSGTYIVTVTDANGCVAVNSIDFTLPDPCNQFSVQIFVSQDSMTNADILSPAVIGGTTPYAYLWSEGSSTITITPTTRGNYSVTVTDANGCAADDDIDY